MKPRVILAVTLITAVLSLFTLSYGTAQSGRIHGTDQGDAEGTRPVKRPKPPKPKGKLSDLRVDQVWLDSQCQINFRLRNAGKYAMPGKEFKGAW